MHSQKVSLIVDSNDYLVDEAIDNVIKWFGIIRDNDSFTGINGLRGITAHEPIGTWGNIAVEPIDYNRLKCAVSCLNQKIKEKNTDR